MILFDEFDTLYGDVLFFVLGELRRYYALRPTQFPSSIVLCGMRDLRDYKAEDGEAAVGSSSPFNIKDRSIRTRSLSREQVAALFDQHTAETGQQFEDEAIDQLMYWTAGQPWLVNRIGRGLCFDAGGVLDRTVPVVATDVDVVADFICQSRETHIDSLGERLRERRVKNVVAPIVTGDDSFLDSRWDAEYATDLGLVTRGADGKLTFANPIYASVVTRYMAEPTLARTLQVSIPAREDYLRKDGSLDEAKLICRFTNFCRNQHYPDALKRATKAADASQDVLDAAEQLLREAHYHVTLAAFLDRIANGGGRVSREAFFGSGRLDLLVEIPRHSEAVNVDTAPVARTLIEVKMAKAENEFAPVRLKANIAQAKSYAARAARGGNVEVVLIIFDARRSNKKQSQLEKEQFEAVEDGSALWAKTEQGVKCYVVDVGSFDSHVA